MEDERFMGVNAQYERDVERHDEEQAARCRRGEHEAPPGGRECVWCGATVAQPVL